MNTVGDICEREVVCAGREATVRTAAGLMRRHHVGCVVVIEEMGGRRLPVGIVTDRDVVVEVAALDLDPRVITVGDLSTAALVTARESDGLLEAMERMRAHRVRRLPVVNEAGELTGIVSGDDLFEALSAQLSELARGLVRGREQEHAARRAPAPGDRTAV